MSVSSALLLGVAVGLLVHDLALAGLRGLNGMLISIAVAGLATVVFVRLAAYQNAKQTETVQLIFAHAGQVWIGPASGPASAPAMDAPLPDLRKMQRYLGLIWLSNSSGEQALIWPDSISTDEHRRLRVWLGINARS